MYCRECFADLGGIVNGRCPVCSTWFNRKDSSSFHRTNSALKRVWERFRHVCVWRGLILPSVPVWIGLDAIIDQCTLLPGASRYGWAFNTSLLELQGWPAVSMGFAWLGLALSLHSHYFWGRVDPFWRFSLLGVIAGIVVIALGWGAALLWAVENIWP